MKAGTPLEVAVDYGQFYLFDAEMGPTTGDDHDLIDDPWLWERRCTASGSAAMVLTMAQHGPTRVEVVVVEGDDAAAADIEAWDHAAELSLAIPSGRLAVAGWDSSGPAHIVDVPPGNIIVRVLWGGLDDAIRADDDALEHLRIEVRSGRAATTRVLRGWPIWTAKGHERVASNGRRLFVGAIALERQGAMTPVNLVFWPPYPSTPDGTVVTLHTEPETGTHFASGHNSDGHSILRELTPDEFDALSAEGDAPGPRYFVDDQGRVWTTMIPLRRNPPLLLVPRANFEMIRELIGDQELEPLPAGWDRFTERTMAKPEPVVVEDIGEPQAGVAYQRWRSDGG